MAAVLLGSTAVLAEPDNADHQLCALVGDTAEIVLVMRYQGVYKDDARAGFFEHAEAFQGTTWYPWEKLLRGPYQQHYKPQSSGRAVNRIV